MVEINSFSDLMIFMGKIAWAFLAVGILNLMMAWLAIWRGRQDENT